MKYVKIFCRKWPKEAANPPIYEARIEVTIQLSNNLSTHFILTNHLIIAAL